MTLQRSPAALVFDGAVLVASDSLWKAMTCDEARDVVGKVLARAAEKRVPRERALQAAAIVLVRVARYAPYKGEVTARFVTPAVSA